MLKRASSGTSEHGRKKLSSRDEVVKHHDSHPLAGNISLTHLGMVYFEAGGGNGAIVEVRMIWIFIKPIRVVCYWSRTV